MQMSFGLFRMCIRGDCVIDITNKRLVRSFAAGGNIFLSLFSYIFLLFLHNAVTTTRAFLRELLVGQIRRKQYQLQKLK